MASGPSQQRGAGDDASAELNNASSSQTILPINYFDRLPNELLVKIFRFYVDKMYVDGLSHRQINEELNGICLTCKRFCYIINNVLLPDPKRKEIPTLYILSSMRWYEIMRKCEYTNDPACFCQNTIRKEAHYMLKHRTMSINDSNLLQKCIPKAIRDESNNLTSIIELYLGYCKFDVEILDNILTSLPNVRRLRLQNLKSCVPCVKNQPQLNLVGRTLDDLSFDFYDKVNDMFEYLLAKLPARIIDAQMASDPENLRWIRRYLLAHRATIEHFGFKLYVDSSKVPEIFQDFSYNIRRDYRGRLEVISSSCPRSIANKMFCRI